MKKILVIISVIVISIVNFVAKGQEFLTVEKVYTSFGDKHLMLSNGDDIYYGSGGGEYASRVTAEEWFDDRIVMDFNGIKEIGKGTYVYHSGDYYSVEKIEIVGVKTIKLVTVGPVETGIDGSIEGAFSYNDFIIETAHGSFKGSVKGGRKDIVNAIFTDGTAISLDLSRDPLWREAKAGMKVRIYKIRRTYLYKPIFSE